MMLMAQALQLSEFATSVTLRNSEVQRASSLKSGCPCHVVTSCRDFAIMPAMCCHALPQHPWMSEASPSQVALALGRPMRPSGSGEWLARCKRP